MNSQRFISAVTEILKAIEGEGLDEELKKTPERVERALWEMLDGYEVKEESLFTTFSEEGKDMIVAVKDIDFTSICSHHLLPFSGVAHVAYLPREKVIGASKLPRLVLAFAHRLQLQERIGRQVAEAIMDNLQPRGVAVIIEASHDCMRCRGVKSPRSKLITSIMLGAFRDDSTLRMELLTLLGR